MKYSLSSELLHTWSLLERESKQVECSLANQIDFFIVTLSIPAKEV